MSICVFSYFPFGFDGRIWIVSVPDHCLSFHFSEAHRTTDQKVMSSYLSCLFLFIFFYFASVDEKMKNILQ